MLQQGVQLTKVLLLGLFLLLCFSMQAVAQQQDDSRYTNIAGEATSVEKQRSENNSALIASFAAAGIFVGAILALSRAARAKHTDYSVSETDGHHTDNALR